MPLLLVALVAFVVVRLATPASIFGWVSDAWNAVTGAVSDVWDAITHVVNWVGGLWSLVTDVFGHLWDAGSWLFHGVIWLATHVADALEWAWRLAWHLFTNVIPHAIGWVLSKLFRWAKAGFLAVYHFVRGLVGKALRFLKGLIDGVRHFFSHLVGWVIHRLAWVWHFIWSLARRAVDLVLHPGRLVRWILADLVMPLARWVFSHSLPVLRWVLHLFEREARTVAHTLENVISRVL